MRHSVSLRLLALLSLLLSACANATAAPTPRVSFTSPADGATVASPVHVKLAAENFTVEPAGAVSAGAGHLHIMVDTPCVAPGHALALWQGPARGRPGARARRPYVVPAGHRWRAHGPERGRADADD